ncbi:hypothetical protein FOPE_10877 [Fonsecaea pedrosoi]|nr:hypothetical protein FOPE_10877 [Fonsecaea pedrosoi]
MPEDLGASSRPRNIDLFEEFTPKSSSRGVCRQVQLQVRATLIKRNFADFHQHVVLRTLATSANQTAWNSSTNNAKKEEKRNLRHIQGKRMVKVEFCVGYRRRILDDGLESSSMLGS